MEDDVIRGATIAHAGLVTFPPPPPKIQAIAAKPKESVQRKPQRNDALKRLPLKADQKSSDFAGMWHRVIAASWYLCPSQLYAAFHCLCIVSFVGFK